MVKPGGTTGNVSRDARVLKGRRTTLRLRTMSGPALLPEREAEGDVVPVVPLKLHHRLMSNAPPAQENCQIVPFHLDRVTSVSYAAAFRFLIFRRAAILWGNAVR